jgi:hypothetical protein
MVLLMIEVILRQSLDISNCRLYVTVVNMGIFFNMAVKDTMSCECGQWLILKLKLKT